MDKFYSIFKEGPLELLVKESGGKIVYIGNKTENTEGFTRKKTRLIESSIDSLTEYLRGDRRDFSIPIEPSGTDFQVKVWKKLMEIPYGEKRSYKEVAEAIGNPRAYQAVGSAIGKNPLLLVIPCHRVLTSEGKLGGFSAGLENKKFLLKLESIDYKKQKY